MKRRFATILLGSISFVVLSAPVWAASGSIEEVVVTASKRPEEVKAVPMAITVLGQDTLDRLNARSFEDFANNVPGLSLTEADATHPVLILRGINAGGDGSTVGTYLDETPYGSSSALANGVDTAPNLDTFDMQRIEVLRGPQGTLYGASTMGGLLKFVTNAPDPSGFDDAIEATGIDMDHGGTGGSIRGMVNVPLSDDLAVRIVGFDQRTPGYIDDTFRNKKNTNSLDSTGGRASVLYRPTDKLSIRLNVLTQNLDAGGNNAEDVIVVGNKIVPKYGDYIEQRTISEGGATRYYVYNATINWDLDWATLTSATSFDLLHDHQFTDATGVYGADVQGFLHQKKLTQELRLASDPGDGPFDWLAGFYYTHEIGTLHQDIVSVPHGTVYGSLQLDSRYVETAGFTNLTYHFTPSFNVSLGGRYAHNSQAANEFGLASAGGSSSGNVFTWSGAAHWDVSDQTALYARVAKGYRPGGPNALPPIVPPDVPASYGPDSLINYEAGVKSDLLDGALSLDADVFYITWNNIQLLTVVDHFAVSNNGGKAKSQGFEGHADWRATDNLTLSFTGAYTDAKLTSDTDPLLVGGRSGDPLPWSPKWSSTLDGDYNFDPIGEWTPYIGASWHYVGDRHSDFSPGTPTQVVLSSYNAIDARVGVEWNKWTIELYGKNLTDAKGVTSFASSGTSAASGLAATAAIMAPREFGIVLRGKI
ncbi:MAG TPA: TonB-dependent receptor [Rhizomicrobium sp.]